MTVSDMAGEVELAGELHTTHVTPEHWMVVDVLGEEIKGWKLLKTATALDMTGVDEEVELLFHGVTVHNLEGEKQSRLREQASTWYLYLL